MDQNGGGKERAFPIVYLSLFKPAATVFVQEQSLVLPESDIESTCLRFKHAQPKMCCSPNVENQFFISWTFFFGQFLLKNFKLAYILNRWSF